MAFDDDDEPHSSTISAANPSHEDAPTAEDALEDEVPDFKLFASLFSGNKNLSGRTIRKGEKDFESHGTRAQDGALEASREAMDEVLSHIRTHRNDVWARAWYFPDRFADAPADGEDGDLRMRERVVVVEHMKGNWSKTVGMVVPMAKDKDGLARMWLLPEEALYLVERGTLDLWWPDREFAELLETPGKYGPEDYDVGIPLSLEAAYSLLIGNDGERGRVTLPKYQVYTHIKRAGFNILRAPLDAPLPEPLPEELPSLWQWLFSFIPERRPKVEPWGPLVQPGLYRSYKTMYARLALISRHKPPVKLPPSEIPTPQDPWKVFYHIWKSGTGTFSKKAPPPPNFRIAVTDAAETGVPTLEQIDSLLLSSAPYEPPSRKPEWRNNPGRMYQRLKHGHKSILVAIVDSGLVNFMRFGEAAFGEEKLFERWDGGMRGGRKGGRGGGRGGARGRGRGRHRR